MMKNTLKKRIEELTSLIGVSGDEWDVVRYIYHALKPYVDEIQVLNNGSILAVKKGIREGQKKILAAHMDEVGYRIKRIDENGFAFFDAIGGATQNCLPGRKMLIRGNKGIVTGIVGVRAEHLMTKEEKKNSQSAQNSYLDLCVGSREEALDLGVYVGASVVPESPCTSIPHNPDYIVTRAADCRVLCAVIIETMISMKQEDIQGEVCAVFSVLEETTVRAIASSINVYKPDYGLFLDTIPCGDVPDIAKGELSVKLGKGPVLVHSQCMPAQYLNVVSHPKLMEAIREITARENITCQTVAFNGAGYSTDAVGAMLSGFGMATVTLACPRRYSHSPVEVFHMQDALNLMEIVRKFAEADVDLNMVGEMP